jgi:hypothetical protein
MGRGREFKTTKSRPQRLKPHEMSIPARLKSCPSRAHSPRIIIAAQMSYLPLHTIQTVGSLQGAGGRQDY